MSQMVPHVVPECVMTFEECPLRSSPQQLREASDQLGRIEPSPSGPPMVMMRYLPGVYDPVPKVGAMPGVHMKMPLYSSCC